MTDTVEIHLIDGREINEDRIRHLTGYLSVTELARFRSFLRPERQRQFVLGRTLLRQALGLHLGVPPELVVLAERRSLAPQLVSPTRSFVGMSISHSSHWIACAVSGATSLGVDIELINAKRDIAALAEQAFPSEKVEWLLSLPPSIQIQNFYRMWCEHEASYKLGESGGHVYHFDYEELILAVCCAKRQISPPVVKRVTLLM